MIVNSGTDILYPFFIFIDYSSVIGSSAIIRQLIKNENISLGLM